MNTFIDRLRDMPMEALQSMIKRQKAEIEIRKRDLETMQKVFDDRIYSLAHPSTLNDVRIKE